MVYTRITGFFSPKSIYPLAAPSSSEKEWIFTLWTSTTPPRPILCKMPHSCYMSLKMEPIFRDSIYDISVWGYILKYGSDRCLESRTLGTNTLVLMTVYTELKPKRCMLTAMLLIMRNPMPTIHCVERVPDRKTLTVIVTVKVAVRISKESNPRSVSSTPVMIYVILSAPENKMTPSPSSLLPPALLPLPSLQTPRFTHLPIIKSATKPSALFTLWPVTRKTTKEYQFKRKSHIYSNNTGSRVIIKIQEND
ncbi:hypothetical protein J3Q64DRAFT_1773988 [Phycomyces blakesleeanus]|uniref:Uncharacterized protein n=3 Tax=Phycomyces blakesleeanus TaxID=4837 RepID=A0A162Y8I3_PHYB8|nr:hypothetical protein PHYBLDRAFT_164077 [Phycomyces blakesleeanus NRRL 1555(-)]OAD78985.1 hypothetical protein PHYBLDRAFT_164077 [Phycomyces blakesleeanus NRRL 1555(-)]|eukprot:XP_018297025.1 hypothetical protein PHYBLDRAFT_164077 [Phycomyces blakesleeanus NRRL 1555(-)]